MLWGVVNELASAREMERAPPSKRQRPKKENDEVGEQGIASRSAPFLSCWACFVPDPRSLFSLYKLASVGLGLGLLSLPRSPTGPVLIHSSRQSTPSLSLHLPQVMNEKQSCVGLGFSTFWSRYMEGSVTFGSVCVCRRVWIGLRDGSFG